MALRFDNLLEAICSQVVLLNETDAQRAYTLGDPKEAKLAYDILLAYGFDAKLYPQKNKTAKLYIMQSGSNPAQLERTLSAAIAYAKSLKSIKENMDALCANTSLEIQSPDYAISFSNLPPAGKQIMIRLTGATTSAIQAHVAPPVMAAQAKAPPKATKTARRSKVQEEDIQSGPAVARTLLPGRKRNPNAQDSIGRRILFFFTTNMAPGTFVMVIMAMVIGIIFSFFVLAKGFLCNDFATAKRHAQWYCELGQE